MNFPVKNLKMFNVGDHGEVPGPEIYWMKEFHSWHRLCFYSFLVDTSKGLLLVNAGLPKDLSLRNDFLKRWAGSERCKFTVSDNQEIEKSLRKTGVSAEEIAHVLITPIQDYTIGRLDLFKNAKIYFSRRGWLEDIATPKNSFLNRDIWFPRSIRKYLFEDAWDRIILVDDQEIVPGVSVKWVGGHHRSSMAVFIELKDRIVSLTDSAFTQRNLDENIPIGIAESTQECLDSYKLLKNSSGQVIPAYDPDNMQRFKEYLVS